MLSLGLTGGIAAGKSLLTTRFRELGAVVIDADQLARDVVAPGTSGLEAIVATFGDRILLPDGSLNRAKLGSLVFADQTARESLNAIVHPRVRAAANALKLDAEPGSIVVQDIPLLVESGQEGNFHLVVVVQAPHEERIARMVRERGMSRAEAMARMAAQASDAQRAAAADVLIANDRGPQEARRTLDALWHGRLLPFAENLAAQLPASLHGVPPEGHSGAAALRVAARLTRALRDVSVQLLPLSQDGDAVLQFRITRDTCPDGAAASAAQLSSALASAGFFPLPNSASGPGAYGDVLGSSQALMRACFASADPGCPALVVSGSAVADTAAKP